LEHLKMENPPDADVNAAMKSARTDWNFSAMGIRRPDFSLLTEVLFRVCQNDEDRFYLATEQLDAAFAAGWKAGQAAKAAIAREPLIASALANLLPSVFAEIEQRKTGGNAEDWEHLEQLATAAARALEGAAA
jgi:hypothetical protein